MLGAARRCGGVSHGHRADAGRHLVLRAREKHRHKAAHHQVVDLLLGLAQAAGRLQGGDDGKVVAHLAVVKHALGGLDVVVIQRGQRVGCEVAHAAVRKHLKGLLDHRHIVLGQRARVGTRVGQSLVALVQALRNLQRGFGRIAKLAIGLALQARQVKQQGRSLRGGLAFFSDRGLLAPAGVGNRLRLGQVPDAVGLFLGVLRIFSVLWVKPLGRVLAGHSCKGRMNLKVVAADKFANLLFALHHHAQGGRLHPAHGG